MYAENKFFKNLLLQIENMAVFPNMLFSTLTFMKFYKNITNKCRRIGSKQISFVCSDITSDIHILSVT